VPPEQLPGTGRSGPALIEAYVRAGRLDDARASADCALSLSRTAGERSIETRALRLLGEIDATDPQLDTERSERHFRDALALTDTLGLRPDAARCHLGLGALYRRVGRREAAEEHLATALTMFSEMQMEYWIEKTTSALKELRDTR
jgi:tetratricopeptide (TPR) repeat protein